MSSCPMSLRAIVAQLSEINMLKGSTQRLSDIHNVCNVIVEYKSSQVDMILRARKDLEAKFSWSRDQGYFPFKSQEWGYSGSHSVLDLKPKPVEAVFIQDFKSGTSIDIHAMYGVTSNPSFNYYQFSVETDIGGSALNFTGKAVITLIISSTDFGILSFNRLIKSGLVMSCMNPEFWCSFHVHAFSFEALYESFYLLLFSLFYVVNLYGVFDVFLCYKKFAKNAFRSST
ncbi:hypothetical protein Tco_0621048 [Tanacetum coccineum]